MSKQYLNLLSNTVIFGLSSLASRLVVFICLPMYTLYLSTNQYGTVDLSQTIINLAVPVLSICISDAILRFGIVKKDERERVLSSGLSLIILGILVFIIMSFPLCRFINLSYSKAFWIIGLYSVISINTFFVAVMKVFDNTRFIAVSSILSSAFVIAFTYIGLAVLSKGISAYYFGLIIGNMVSIIVYSTIILKQKIVIFSHPSKPILKEMISYSGPLVPNTVFWWANNGLDKICLRLIIGLGATGIYASTAKIPSILNLLVSVFQQALNLSAIQVYQEKVQSFWNKLGKHYNHLLVVFGSWLITGIPLIVSLLLKGDEFSSGKIIIPILLLSVYYCAKSSFLGSIFTGSGNSKSLFVSTAIGTFINLILNIAFIKLWGLIGAASATCISNIVVFIIRFYLGAKETSESIITVFSPIDLLLIVQAIIYSFFSVSSILIHCTFSLFITLYVVFSLIKQTLIKSARE